LNITGDRALSVGKKGQGLVRITVGKLKNKKRKGVNCKKKELHRSPMRKERIPRLSSAAAKHEHDDRQPKSKREEEEKIYRGVKETS
jgi:hypothetical protein